MLRLYYREGTGRPRRVRWALEEAGAPYEYVQVSADDAIGHPLGRVPVLETAGGSLFESAALCLQVADLHPEAGLIAAPGTQERGEIYQWALFAMTELESAIIQVYRAERGDDAAATESARKRLANVFDALEQALVGRTYLVSERFTIADVVVGGVLSTAKQLDLMSASPNVSEYAGRLDARPAKQKAYA